MYELVQEAEEAVGREVALVMQVGDLGVWPDVTRLDKATKKRGDGGDFAQWLREEREAPRPTVFIAGNHEDFHYLAERGGGELLPGLHFLPWGQEFVFSSGGETLRIGGLGGCFGASDYDRLALVGKRRRHYLRSEIEKLMTRTGPPLDVLLLHDAPEGICDGLPPQGHNRVTSRSQGLATLVATVAPRICLTGHLHFRTERRLNGVRVAGLSIVPAPGCVMILEFGADGAEPEVLYEYKREITTRPITGGEQHSSLWDQDSPEAQARLSYGENIDALLLHATTWAEEIRAGQSLRRNTRLALYQALSENPHRSLLMGALNKSISREGLVRDLDPQDAEDLRHQWDQHGLPPTAPLHAILHP